MRYQTSTEYLVIISVVVIIGLLVVSVLGGIPAIGGGAKERAAVSELRTNEIATESWRVSNASTILTLRNKKTATITIDGLDINGTACDYSFPITLGVGAAKEITCTNINFTTGSTTYDFSYNISWTNQDTQGTYAEDLPNLVGTSTSATTPPVITVIYEINLDEADSSTNLTAAINFSH